MGSLVIYGDLKSIDEIIICESSGVYLPCVMIIHCEMTRLQLHREAGAVLAYGEMNVIRSAQIDGYLQSHPSRAPPSLLLWHSCRGD